MKSFTARADEVQVGDNVWEHNIVTSIKTGRLHENGREVLVFNSETITPWISHKDTLVLVTNRPNAQGA